MFVQRGALHTPDTQSPSQSQSRIQYSTPQPALLCSYCCSCPACCFCCCCCSCFVIRPFFSPLSNPAVPYVIISHQHLTTQTQQHPINIPSLLFTVERNATASREPAAPLTHRPSFFPNGSLIGKTLQQTLKKSCNYGHSY